MKLYFSAFLFLVIAALLPALDLWQHPEAAEGNSLFLGVSAPLFSFDGGFEFKLSPELTLDYLPPLPLPFSLGAFLKTPSPNLKSFGLRTAWHINLDRPRVDLYFLYVFDFGFVRNRLLEKYNDERAGVHYFDFRCGVRWRINRFLFLQIESGFKFRSIIAGVSIKLF